MANRPARKPQSTEAASEKHSMSLRHPSRRWKDPTWTFPGQKIDPTKNEAYGEWGNFAVPWASEALPFIFPCGIPALRFLPASFIASCSLIVQIQVQLWWCLKTIKLASPVPSSFLSPQSFFLSNSFKIPLPNFLLPFKYITHCVTYLWLR